MWIINAGTRCHQQDTPYYCGAASAQMVLNFLRLGLISQDDLFLEGRLGNIPSKWGTGWSIDPDGMKNILDTHQSHAQNGSYDIVVDNSFDTTIESILLALNNSRNPVPILVFNERHWIVITGAKTDVEPIPGGTCKLLGFNINNPWPPCPSAYDINITSPPPHQDSDTCGTGGVNGSPCNSYITFDNLWCNTYLSGYYDPIDHFKRYIFLTNTRIVKRLKFTGEMYHKYVPPGDIVEIETIKERLMADLNIHGLIDDEKFATTIKNANLSKPILVQRLDRPGSYYYLIPLESNKAITAMAIVDGMSGRLQEFSAYKDPIDSPIISRGRALEKVMERPIDMGKEIGRLKFREGTFSFHPVMVWKPCKESMSPNYPFYMFTLGDKQVYMDYRGTIYTQLHDDEKA